LIGDFNKDGKGIIPRAVHDAMLWINNDKNFIHRQDNNYSNEEGPAFD
jgi:hypothetical protein